MFHFREIVHGDVPAIFKVRVATRENAYTMEELQGLGITVNSVSAMIDTTHRGWLCEDDDLVVGFAMGNRKTGEMWVIAVLPEYEGRGIGAKLLAFVETWLWSEGWCKIWLTTDIDPTLRAYGFYRNQGWLDHEIRNDLRYMRKAVPNNFRKSGVHNSHR